MLLFLFSPSSLVSYQVNTHQNSFWFSPCSVFCVDVIGSCWFVLFELVLELAEPLVQSLVHCWLAKRDCWLFICLVVMWLERFIVCFKKSGEGIQQTKPCEEPDMMNAFRDN